MISRSREVLVRVGLATLLLAIGVWGRSENKSVSQAALDFLAGRSGVVYAQGGGTIPESTPAATSVEATATPTATQIDPTPTLENGATVTPTPTASATPVAPEVLQDAVISLQALDGEGSPLPGIQVVADRLAPTPQQVSGVTDDTGSFSVVNEITGITQTARLETVGPNAADLVEYDFVGPNVDFTIVSLEHGAEAHLTSHLELELVNTANEMQAASALDEEPTSTPAPTTDPAATSTPEATDIPNATEVPNQFPTETPVSTPIPTNTPGSTPTPNGTPTDVSVLEVHGEVGLDSLSLAVNPDGTTVEVTDIENASSISIEPGIFQVGGASSENKPTQGDYEVRVFAAENTDGFNIALDVAGKPKASVNVPPELLSSGAVSFNASTVENSGAENAMIKLGLDHDNDGAVDEEVITEVEETIFRIMLPLVNR